LQFRYALISGNRPLALSVNGVLTIASLGFPATGSFNTWAFTGTNIFRNPARISCGSPPSVPAVPILITCFGREAFPRTAEFR
jgi:hypothetical protein